jgi:hypothetical protein
MTTVPAIRTAAEKALVDGSPSTARPSVPELSPDYVALRAAT